MSDPRGEIAMSQKPLGRKNYGSIPHLPGSRRGRGDHHCHEGQARIATELARDKHDEIFVQEKLDGANVGVALLNGEIISLGRAGYRAVTSKYEQHIWFHRWVAANEDRFRSVLNEGERLVGEWLMQAHGTRYHIGDLVNMLVFAPFDIMVDAERMPCREFRDRMNGIFLPPASLGAGPMTADEALSKLGDNMRVPRFYGHHWATEPVEGAVWRVERDKLQPDGSRKRVVDFLVKYVRPDKVDGLYLEGDPVWNVTPEQMRACIGER